MSAIEQAAVPRNFAIRKARERRAGKPIPKYVILEVTFRCNLRCIHCAVEPCLNKGRSNELSFIEVTGILDQLFNFGVFNVVFSGGEPLCRPDFLEIVDYAKNRGLFFMVKTNGTLMSDTVAKRLKQAGITGVHVSLYGATAETHERITGVTGSFRETMAGIENLRRARIPVIVMTSIMKYNVHEDAEIKKLATKFDAVYQPDPKIFPRNGEPGSAGHLRIDDVELREWIERNAWKGHTEDGLEKHLLCAAGRVMYGVSPAGDIYPCPLWRRSLGNVREQSFKDIVYGEAATAIRNLTIKDFPTCVKCELAQYCARCPGLAYAENSDISGPSPESCRVARVAKGVIADGY